MRIVFLMEQDAYTKSCADRTGQPGRPWTQGGHHVIALKIGDHWEVMNTTSLKPEFYLSGLKLPARLTQVNFTQVPMKLIYAGDFDAADYLAAFTFMKVYNIYVSGNPTSNICK